jgi:hypothetical protein
MNVYYTIYPNNKHLDAITKKGTSNLKTLIVSICDASHLTFEGYCEKISDMAEEVIDHGNNGIYYNDLNIEEVKHAYRETFNKKCPESWSKIDISIEDTKAMSLFVLAYVLTFKYYLFEGTYNGKRMFNLMRNDYEKNCSVYNFNVEIFPDTNMIDCQLIRDEILKKA